MVIMDDGIRLNAKLVLIPGDTHCYDHHLEAATEAVAEWIRKQLSGE